MNIISSIFKISSPEIIGAYYFLSKPESRKDNYQFSRQLCMYYIHFSLTYQYVMLLCKEAPSFLAALLPGHMETIVSCSIWVASSW